MMIANAGTLVRAIRLVPGLALIAAAMSGGRAAFIGTALRSGETIVSLVRLATAALPVSPLYTAQRIKTCPN